MPPLSRSFSRDVRAEDGDGGGRLHRAPPNPNDVKINVEGAFIIDDESPCSEAKNGTVGEGVYFENKDIRLPHHTAVVSHVAVDVSTMIFQQKSSSLSIRAEHLVTPVVQIAMCSTDRRIPGEGGLLLSGACPDTRRRPAELPEFRNRSD